MVSKNGKTRIKRSNQKHKACKAYVIKKCKKLININQNRFMKNYSYPVIHAKNSKFKKKIQKIQKEL
jgi:hypothetical protein